MPKICISYRRSDSEGITGRIFDRLVAHYGKDAVFRDIDSIPAGTDFREHLKQVLSQTDVLLAIVGPKWVGARRGGKTRLNEENDLVRIEVATALQGDTLVIPILIGETRMPVEQLPPALKDFAFRNALTVDPGLDFDQHMQRLIRSIDARRAGKPAPDGSEAKAVSQAPVLEQVRATQPGQPATSRQDVQPLASASAKHWPKLRLFGAILGLAAVTIVALLWHEASIQQIQSEATRRFAVQQQELAHLVKEQGVTPSDLHHYSDSIVYITNEWYLHDRLTRRQVYQRMAQINGEILPCFVKMDNGSIVRWLTLDDQSAANIPIGIAQTGSGFAVSDTGYLITNKRFAAGWMLPYTDNWEKGRSRAAIYPNHKSDAPPTIGDPREVDGSVSQWVPGTGGYVFDGSAANPISANRRELYGQNESLTVQFPGTRLSIAANALRTSPDVDLSLLKIDSAQDITKLELADDDSVQVGERVFLVGYKPVSQPPSGGDQTASPALSDPTFAEAIISRLPNPKDKQRAYQFDGVPITGTSGGPVLSATSGKAIAILTAPDPASNTVVAIPVSYLRELLRSQRGFD
jgi:hypothetical protein